MNNVYSTIYVGLGANLDNPIRQLENAIGALNKIPETRLIQYSSFYRTAPMGPQDQNDYINAVAQLESQLSPLALLDQLQLIENNQGRVRKAERWGPRTLDLDILLIDDNNIESARLTVPHYGIKQRNFVLIPLLEIAPSLILPCGQSVAALVELVGQSGIEKL